MKLQIHNQGILRLGAVFLAVALCLSFLTVGTLTASAQDPEEGSEQPTTENPEEQQEEQQEEQPIALGFSFQLASNNKASDAGGPLVRARSFSTSAGGVNYYDQLSNEQKAFYDALVPQLLAGTASFTIPGSWTFGPYPDATAGSDFFYELEELIQPAYDALRRDYPEITWMDGMGSGASGIPTSSGGSTTYAVSSIIITLTEYPLVPVSNASEMAAVASAVSTVVSGASGSDYDKLKHIHDWLANNVQYDPSFPSISDERSHEASKALMEGIAVCEGYAKAFKLMCDEMGIPCVLVSGDGVNPSTSSSEAHMWNLVRLSGSWYAVDVTWDDQTDGPLNQVIYDYFLVGATTTDRSGNAFSATHQQDGGDFSASGYKTFTYPSLSSTAYDGSSVTPPPAQGGSEYYDVTANYQNGWYSQDIVVTPTGHNGYTQVGTSDSGPFGGSVTLSNETAGDSVTLYFHDGTNTTTGVVLSYKLDKTAPVISSVNYAQTKDELSGTLTVNASDALSGVDSISVTGPGGALEQTGTNTFKVTQSGAHLVTVTDAAGNAQTHTETVTIRTLDSIDLFLSGTNVTGSTRSYTSAQTLSLSAVPVNTVGQAQSGDYTLVWSSSNPGVATVDQNGQVALRNPGRAVISASALNVSGAFTAELSLRIPANQTGSSVSIVIPEDSVPAGSNADDLVIDVGPVNAVAEAALVAMASTAANDSNMSFYALSTVLYDTVQNTAVTPAGQVTITLPLPTGSSAGYTFVVYSTVTASLVPCTVSSAGITIETNDLAEFVIGYRAGSTGTTKPGKSGGGGGGSGGRVTADGNRAAALVQTSVTSQPVTASDANTALSSALNAAKSAGSSTATVRFANKNTISLEILSSMAKQAAQAGVTLAVYGDTLSGESLQTRMYFNPAIATKAVNLSASYTATDTLTVKAFFEKHFKNSVQVLHLGQSDDFGMPVTIATRMPLNGLDTSNLVFYSYNRATNSYRRIQTTYRIDANGYLHFTTSMGGEIVVTSGVLEVK